MMFSLQKQIVYCYFKIAVYLYSVLYGILKYYNNYLFILAIAHL